MAVAMREAREAALVEEVRSLIERNQRLERALASSRAREESLWKKIELMRIEERKLEEAEERLCAQLGQLEVEYVEQSREQERRLEIERVSKQELQAKVEELERRLQEAQQAKIDVRSSGFQSDQQQRQQQELARKRNLQGLERLMVPWYKPVVESCA